MIDFYFGLPLLKHKELHVECYCLTLKCTIGRKYKSCAIGQQAILLQLFLLDLLRQTVWLTMSTWHFHHLTHLDRESITAFLPLEPGALLRGSAIDAGKACASFSGCEVFLHQLSASGPIKCIRLEAKECHHFLVSLCWTFLHVGMSEYTIICIRICLPS